jgi:hypothetical protein
VAQADSLPAAAREQSVMRAKKLLQKVLSYSTFY